METLTLRPLTLDDAPAVTALLAANELVDHTGENYSEADIAQLRRILDLTAEGLNLAGVKRVLELEAELERVRSELAVAADEARDALESTHRRYRRELVPVSQAVEVYRKRNR